MLRDGLGAETALAGDGFVLFGAHLVVEGLFHITSFVAAALGGIAGVLIGLNFNAITPFMGQPMLHKGIAVIILGGMGDIRGALIGGLILVLMIVVTFVL